MSNDFVIENGVLKKYTGNGGDVVIPEGITSIGEDAFSECCSLTSMIIPDSVTSISDGAFSGCTRLTSVIIPNSVTSIGEDAFSECCSLTSMVIPDSVTSISDFAFSGCTSLTSVTLPNSVTSIGDYAFSDCTSLTSMIIPASITSIGDEAFSGCISLTSLKIPDSVTRIGQCAFSGCTQVQTVHLPQRTFSLGQDAFKNCPAIKEIHASDPAIFAKQKKNALRCLTSFLHDPSPLNSARGQAHSEWFSSNISDCRTLAFSDNELLEKICSIGLLSQDEADSWIEFAQIKKKKVVMGILENYRAHAPKAEAFPLPPEEQLVTNALDQKGLNQQQLTELLKKMYGLTPNELPAVQSVDGRTERPYLLAWLLMIHEKLEFTQSERPHSIVSAAYEKPGISEEAAAVIQHLDAISFQAVLIKMADQNLGLSGYSKQMFLAFPICRYADEHTMQELLKRAPKWKSTMSGNDAPPLRTFREACLFSEHREVMVFADKYGDLDKYAALRGTDGQTIRDTVMADFGLDRDGKKHYDIGGTTIVLSLQKDLSLSLFDIGQNKVVKSVPKKGNDATLVEAATKDIAEIKKNVKKVAKNRSAKLFSDFLSGAEQEANKWKSVFMENALLRQLAELVVWSQGKETFTVMNGACIHADGTIYSMDDQPVRLAHPMEMGDRATTAWQGYFTQNALKQPFEQVWEPVIAPEDVRIDRYANAEIPYFRFLHAEQHGISTSGGLWGSECEITFADCDVDVKQLVYRRDHIEMEDGFVCKSIRIKDYTRQANHIVAYLDRATVYNRVISDDVTVVQYLHNFTAAQVADFIRLSTEHKTVNVTAALLQYKQEHFPDVDPMAEFTLDW